MNPTLDSGPEFNQAEPAFAELLQVRAAVFTGIRCIRWLSHPADGRARNDRAEIIGFADFYLPVINLFLFKLTVTRFNKKIRFTPPYSWKMTGTGRDKTEDHYRFSGRMAVRFQHAALAAWRRVADAK